jgi:hypothetical protein
MKKYFLIFTISLIFVSCKTTKRVNCDAYTKNVKKTDVKYGGNKQDLPYFNYYCSNITISSVSILYSSSNISLRS